MADTPAEDYREIAAHFTELVRGADDAATWERPAPVPGWTARDVVRHLVDWFPGFLAAGSGIELPKGPGVDQDPVAAWEVMSNGVQAVLDDPATQDKEWVHPHVGQLPVPTAVAQFFTTDVFLHSWDLARATGQDETLDPVRCETVLTGMEPMDDVLRASGQFGPKVVVDDDADVQTRLLAFIGRDPRRG